VNFDSKNETCVSTSESEFKCSSLTYGSEIGTTFTPRLTSEKSDTP